MQDLINRLIPYSVELFTKAEFRCVLASNLTYITCLKVLVAAAATSSVCWNFYKVSLV